MTPEQRQSQAIAARQFTENPLFKAMFEGVADALESKALLCDPTDKDRAADIIRCKQLLVAMRREIERRAEDQEFAAFEIEQLQKRSKVRQFTRSIWKD
jgi:trehalose-6-phosphate synthase